MISDSWDLLEEINSMWKESSLDPKHDNDSAIGDSAGEESSNPHQKSSSFEDSFEKDPLLKMNEGFGITMPNCLLESTQYRNTSKNSVNDSNHFNSSKDPGFVPKLGNLLAEMHKLRELDREILYKFTRINDNVQKMKCLMDERVADLQKTMPDYQSLQSINDSINNKQTTTKTENKSDSEDEVYVVPINTTIPLAYAVTKRTNSNQYGPMVSAKQPATPATNHLANNQLKRNLNKSSRSSGKSPNQQLPSFNSNRNSSKPPPPPSGQNLHKSSSTASADPRKIKTQRNLSSRLARNISNFRKMTTGSHKSTSGNDGTAASRWSKFTRRSSDTSGRKWPNSSLARSGSAIEGYYVTNSDDVTYL